MTQSEDDFLKEIGRRFKKLRKDRKLTIVQVATGAKLSRNTIKAMEEGRTDFLLSSMGRVCRFYNIAPSELVKGY